MSTYTRLKDIVTNHGEAHAVVEEHDQELEIRLGQTEWHDDEEAFTLYHPTVNDGYPVETFESDRLIRLRRPTSLWE